MAKPKTKTKRARKSRIPAVVPKIVFSTMFVGVVPACVVSACSGGSTLTAGDGAVPSEARPTFDVAVQCFGDSTSAACQMAVAAVAFQCFDGSTQPGCPPPPFDAGFDGPDDANDDADGAG